MKVSHLTLGIMVALIIAMAVAWGLISEIQNIEQPIEPPFISVDTFYVYLVQIDWGIKTAVRFEAATIPKPGNEIKINTRKKIIAPKELWIWKNLRGETQEVYLREDDRIHYSRQPVSWLEALRGGVR